jgi:Arc/MetJ-type ribon-helix-helix transcriptional regulator
MPPELEAKLDAWIGTQPEPRPSKSEAMRRLLETALELNRSLKTD